MTETQIRKYAELMREMDLTGFEVTEDKRKIRLERGGSASITSFPSFTNERTEGVDLIGGEKGEADMSAAPSLKQSASQDFVSIKSPVVGVFYAAAAENADPYVVVGDEVAMGQTVCIIEAMKLMTEIQEDAEGTIAEICVANGQVVEYGTELFRVRRKA